MSLMFEYTFISLESIPEYVKYISTQITQISIIYVIIVISNNYRILTWIFN